MKLTNYSKPVRMVCFLFNTLHYIQWLIQECKIKLDLMVSLFDLLLLFN